MVTFNSLKVGDYFYFTEGCIRKKVSITKYIWICDYQTPYCKNEKDEEISPRWVTKKRHIEKCVIVNFKY